MKNILITGGTVFISRYLAEYYVSKGENVYVINRNTKKQSIGVKLIECDRHFLGDRLKNIHFDLDEFFVSVFISIEAGIGLF